jgi:hypothetical protein
MSGVSQRRAAILFAALAIVASAWLVLRRGDANPVRGASAARGAANAPERAPSPRSLEGVAGPRDAHVATGATESARVQVVDVRTDAPVPQLEFVRRRPQAGEEGVESALGTNVESAGATDADGWLALEKDAAALPWPTPPSGWRLVTTSATTALQTGRLHVGRVLRIVGRVRADAGVDRTLPLADVRVAAVAYGPPDARLTTPDAEAPSSVRWLRQHRLDAIPAHSYDPRTGAFEILGVRLPWFGVTASATGWYAPPVDVSDRVPDADGVIEVDVPLRPRPTVRGRVLGEDGRPIAGARLRLQVRVRTTWADFNPSRALIEGTSLAVTGYPGGGDVVLNYASEYVTGSDGSYALDVPAEGEVVLVARAEAHAPERVETPASRDSNADLTLRRRDGVSVRLLSGGSPVADTKVLLHDMTDRDRQIPLGFVPIARDGTVAAEWLETSHEYMFQVMPSGRRCFVRWQGQRELDLSVESDTPASLDAEPKR